MIKNAKKWGFGFVVSLLSFALQAQPPAPWKIGVLYWSDTIACQRSMRHGLEQEVLKINAAAHSKNLPEIVVSSAIAGDGPQGIERQITQMRQMIASKPHAIIVQPTDNAALSEPLKIANEAGIPVIAYDQYVSSGKLAAYITSDNYQAGYLGGEYMASLFPAKNPLRLVLVEYPSVSSTVERLNGFLDAMRDQGKRYKILKTYRAVQPDEGQKAGQALLRDFPQKDSIDIIFTVNDGGGVAVVDVLAKAGRTEIAHASIDGDPQAIQNIRAQRLTRIDAAQFCGPMGATALSTAYAILQGKKIQSPVLIPTFPITRETLDQYPGWEGPIPPSFKKTWPSKNPVWQGKSTQETP